MSSGTVGYTDRMGNRDYLSVIAKQVGRRLKESSDMASEERAYAAGMAEAGGTSLSEAGIGKGYFFGRALGNRFGGDRIARTKGRMGVGGDANNPTSNYKQRFRGGFDYKVTNEISNNSLTDVQPLSNALVVGLRGVEEGLGDVAGAIQRQGTVLNSLSQNSADMAKAIMFNGYLFAMFQNKQKQKAGRDSLRREERSIEGGGRGRIGGSSFGGAGGRRGMINVTGGGSGGGAGGGKGSKSFQSIGGAGFLSPTAFLSAGADHVKTSMSAGQNMISSGLKGASTYTAMSTGDIVGMMGTNSLYKKYNIDVAEIAAKNPSNIAQAAARMFGFKGDQADTIADIVQGGTKNPKYADSAAAAAKKFGDFYKTSDSYVKGILEADVIAKQFGKNPDAIAVSFQNALSVMRDNQAIKEMFQKGTLGSAEMLDDQKIYLEAYEMVTKKYGEKNADQFMKLGLFGVGDAFNVDDLGNSVLRNDAIADSLAKNYSNMTYDSLEKAVLMARVGDMTEQGMSSTKIIKELRKTMGNNVADDLILKYGDDVLSNSAVGKLFGKGSAKVGIRRVLKAIPGIGLGLGIVFGIQRAMQGDLLGAGLEISSGVLGLNPATTGLGMGIDGFLLARDLGAIQMAKGGTGSLITSLLGPSILNKATVAGFTGNNAVVGGEAGKEAFIPLEGTQGEIAGSVFGKANAISFINFLKKKKPSDVINDLRYKSDHPEGTNQPNPYSPGSTLYNIFERHRQYDMHGLELSMRNMNSVTQNNADPFQLSNESAMKASMVAVAPVINNYYQGASGGGNAAPDRDEVLGGSFASLDLQQYYAKMGDSRK